MIRFVSLFMTFAFLASCGADGMPTTPEPREKTVEKAEEPVQAT
jgi:hypothetical protein